MTNEITTEPTTLTLHQRLVKAAPRHYVSPEGTTYVRVGKGSISAIQREIEDAATRPLREKLKRVEEELEFSEGQRHKMVADLDAAHTKHDALKAKADALWDEVMRAYLSSPKSADWDDVYDALSTYSTAEPREETHDGQTRPRHADGLRDSDHGVGIPVVGREGSPDGIPGRALGEGDRQGANPESTAGGEAHVRASCGVGEAGGGTEEGIDGDAGSDGVAAPSPDPYNGSVESALAFLADKRAESIERVVRDAIGPSPDRDECPGGDCGCKRLVRDLFPDAAPSPDRHATDHEMQLWEDGYAEGHQEGMRAVAWSLRNLADQLTPNEETTVSPDRDGEPGEADALEKKYAECDVSWTPDGMQTQIDELRERLDELSHGQRYTDPDIAALLAKHPNPIEWIVKNLVDLMKWRKDIDAEFADQAKRLMPSDGEPGEADGLDAAGEEVPWEDPFADAQEEDARIWRGSVDAAFADVAARLRDLERWRDAATERLDAQMHRIGETRQEHAETAKLNWQAIKREETRLDAIERRHRKLRKRVGELAEDIEFGFTQSDEIFTGIKRRYDELAARLAALEAEWEPGAVSAVTDEMVEAAGSRLITAGYVVNRAAVHSAIEEALKAGGAK